MMLSQRLGPKRPSPSGSPAHILKLRDGLAELQVTCTLCDCEAKPSDFGKESFADSVLSGWTAPFKFLSVLKNRRVDVVHCHGPIPALLAILLRPLHRRPVVYEIHGIYLWSQRFSFRGMVSFLIACSERFLAGAADRVIAQSDAMVERIVEFRRVKRERVVRMYPPFAPPAVVSTNVEGSPDERRKQAMTPTVCYVGSTHHYQGLPLLAQAQKVWAKTLNCKLELIVSSDWDGDDSDVISAFGFLPGFTTVIRDFPSSELPARLKQATVLVHARPNCIDNINVQSKIALYLSTGIPIVVTDVYDYGTLFRNSLGVVLCDTTPDSFAAGVIKAVTDVRVQRCAEQQNPALCKRHFNLSTNAQLLKKIYEAVLPTPNSVDGLG